MKKTITSKPPKTEEVKPQVPTSEEWEREYKRFANKLNILDLETLNFLVFYKRAEAYGQGYEEGRREVLDKVLPKVS